MYFAGGLGKMNIPILADKTHDISRRYGVLKVKILNKKGILLIG